MDGLTDEILINSKESSLIIYQNCIPVDGYLRSIVYDLQNNMDILVPKKIANDIRLIHGKEMVEIEELIQSGVIDRSSVEFILKSKIGCIVDKSLKYSFPSINLSFEHFSLISNAIIDICQNSNLTKYLNLIESLNCFHFLLRLRDISEIDKVQNSLENLVNSRIISVQIALPYKLEVIDKIEKLCLYSRVDCIFLMNCPSEIIDNNPFKNLSNKVFFCEQDNLEDITIDYLQFQINPILFSESQNYNTFYNRKIYISGNGLIKNAPECYIDFGNINDIKSESSLFSIVENSKFKKYWEIRKDLIDVCKICEFRYMCVDPSLPLRREDGSWYRSKECNYNPFICKWDIDPEYLSLSDCGIVCDQSRMDINEDRLIQINSQIWGTLD